MTAAALALVALAAAGAAPAPSPDARALAPLVVPRALVDGFVAGLAEETADRAAARVPRAREEAVRRDARAAAREVAGRALAEPVLVEFAAGLLARHHAAEELAALLAWHRSELGRRLAAFRAEVAQLEARPGAAPAELARERDALAARTFTAEDERRLAEFAASPAGRRASQLAPELTAAWLDFLDERVRAERPALEARLEAISAAAREPPPEPDAADR